MSDVERKKDEGRGPDGKFVFQLLAGEHQGKKRKYVKGDIFKSVEPLDELFSGKFQRMPYREKIMDEDVDDAPPRQTTALQERPVQIATGTNVDPMVFDFNGATEVTPRFSLARKVGLEVWKDTLGAYAICEAGVKVRQNIVGQPLASKQVSEFLAEWVRSDPNLNQED